MPPTSPPRTFSRQALRQLDELAEQEFGIPTLVLMENAAAALARVCLAQGGLKPGDAVVVVCGGGSNGGDGLAAARHLDNAGCNPRPLLLRRVDDLRGDAAVNGRIARAMGLPLVEPPPGGWTHESLRPAFAHAAAGARVLVDAVLGTGADRPVEASSPAGLAVALINAWRAGRNAAVHTAARAVVAADLPSGMDADTGRGLVGTSGDCVRADFTVTFTGHKRGFAAPGAAAFTGGVVVADVGAPRNLVERLADPLAPDGG